MKTLNLDQAAAVLHMSAYTLRELAAAGTVPGAKIGRSWVFVEDQLEQYVLREITHQTRGRRDKKPVPTARNRTRRAPPPLN